MKHISLFSGIGGFDLAAEWMGWENVAHCEWNSFGQQILKHYWPNAITYEDITKTDFTIHRGTIDILSGGFPCQPYSSAGKRKGKEDERHLWPEMLRAIREIQPRWVVGENVRGIITWNRGMVFDEVQADLENEGYEVTPFLLPASGINAPHERYRTWFIAHSNHEGGQEKSNNRKRENNEPIKKRNKVRDNTRPTNALRNVAGSEKYKPRDFNDFPTEHPISNGNDGLSEKLDRKHFNRWRTEAIKAGGNAIVPQVAHQIFKAINQYEAR